MPYCIATDKALISMGGRASIFLKKGKIESKVDETDKVGIKWHEDGKHYFRTVDGWSANHADAAVVDDKAFAETFAFELAMEQPPFMGHLHVLKVVWKPISREFEIRGDTLFVSKAEKSKDKKTEE